MTKSYLFNRIDAVSQQRYLFRAATFTSRGKHDKTTINTQSREGDHRADIFRVEARLAREQIRAHLSWERHKAEVVLSSWSTSLIFVLIHAWKKQAKISKNNKVEKEDILFYVLDTQLLGVPDWTDRSQYHPNKIYSAAKLISWFSPALMRSDLYDHEYLISGKLVSTKTRRLFDCVSLEELKKAGLTTLMPELENLKLSTHLATDYQDMQQAFNQSTLFLREDEVKGADKIASIFKNSFQDAIRLSLIALRRRCTNVTHDPILRDYIVSISKQKDKIASVKPPVTDAVHPVEPGDSGVADSDRTMLLWRAVCANHHCDITRSSRPNQGLEIVQDNEWSFPAEEDFDGALHVQPLYAEDGETIVDLQRIDINAKDNRENGPSEEVSSERPQALRTDAQHEGDHDSPNIAYPPQAIHLPLDNEAEEIENAAPSDNPERSAKRQCRDNRAIPHLTFHISSYKDVVHVITNHFEKVQKERDRAVDQALAANQGFMPIFGPAPLGLKIPTRRPRDTAKTVGITDTPTQTALQVPDVAPPGDEQLALQDSSSNGAGGVKRKRI